MNQALDLLGFTLMTVLSFGCVRYVGRFGHHGDHLVVVMDQTLEIGVTQNPLT